MATAAQDMAESSRPLVWFWEFVKNELKPYPGRGELVARIVVSTTTVIAFGLASVYVLVGGTFALGDPPMRVLWIMGTLFIMFYGIRVIANYSAAIAFGLLIVFTIPLWDMHTPVELK